MRYSWIMTVACAAMVCTLPVLAGNYVLTIDGEKHEVDLGQTTTVKLAGGKSVEVTLEKKAVVTFKVDNFSFDHPSNVTPSRSDLGEGIHQTMMTTPLGTLVLIQEYTNIDPSVIVDAGLMVMTQVDGEAAEADKAMIETFWKTFSTTMK